MPAAWLDTLRIDADDGRVGIPGDPPYQTDPRHLLPGERPLKVSPIVPAQPVTAAAGAVTVMLPAEAEPSSHENKVKFAEPGTLKPCTYTM